MSRTTIELELVHFEALVAIEVAGKRLRSLLGWPRSPS
jgi:hypothetical protein